MHGDGAALLGDRREIAPREQLHDHVRRAVCQRADVEHAHHVLALDADLRASLLEEACDQLLVSCDLGQEHLDGHLLLQLEMGRGDHDAHAALSEHALDTVLLGQEASGEEGRRHANLLSS